MHLCINGQFCDGVFFIYFYSGRQNLSLLLQIEYIQFCLLMYFGHKQRRAGVMELYALNSELNQSETIRLEIY